MKIGNNVVREGKCSLGNLLRFSIREFSKTYRQKRWRQHFSPQPWQFVSSYFTKYGTFGPIYRLSNSTPIDPFLCVSIRNMAQVLNGPSETNTICLKNEKIEGRKVRKNSTISNQKRFLNFWLKIVHPSTFGTKEPRHNCLRGSLFFNQ